MSSALPPQSPDTASRNILLEQVGLNLYRENAFRVTGLAVDASTKEIARHADKLKIMEELGQRDRSLITSSTIRIASQRSLRLVSSRQTGCLLVALSRPTATGKATLSTPSNR